MWLGQSTSAPLAAAVEDFEASVVALGARFHPYPPPALPPRQPSPVEQRRQLPVPPPSCELLDSASPEAVLRALALADKLADPALVSLCETILAARVFEVSHCSAFVALATQSPAEAARLMARAEAATLATSVVT